MGHTPGMSSPAASAPYTWDDFVALEEDDLRELIDGELVEVEVPTLLHEYIVSRLCGFLNDWALPRKAGFAVASGYKVRITNRRGVMPDVQFFRSGKEHPGRTELGLVSGHPDLAVEVVSTSSARYDRMTKLAWYASIGTPEYWIVDPSTRMLERLALQVEHYLVAEVLGDDAVFRPDSFEGLEIPLAELWTMPLG
jgi:Uma2 family endonuclease